MSTPAIRPPATVNHGDLLAFRVHGTPAPQGSKRHVGNGVMVESSKKVKPWRQDVKHAALEAMGEDFTAHPGPVAVTITFYLPRPASHLGTGRNAGLVKASAPEHPGVRPDLDKLVRSTLDALVQAGAIRDDSKVVELAARKRYVLHKPAGAFVEVWPL